jgi:hypothetical protein
MTTMAPDNPNPQRFQFGPIPNDRFEHPHLPYYAFSMVAFGDSGLVVGLPMGGSVQFDLRRFPTRTWVALQDNTGEQIPLSIYIDGGLVAGQWLEPQPVPSPMPQVMA